MEFAPNVHRVENVIGSNSVLLLDEQMAVVDTGIPGNGERIVDYIKSLGRSPRDLRWIITTHHHIDHSGSAAELHELTGAQVVAHTAETEAKPDGTRTLIKGTEAQHIPAWYRWIIGARRRPQQRPAIPEIVVQQTVQEGDVLPCQGGITVLHTPGHTPGSICLVVSGPQMLFLGDSAINNRTRLSRPLMWDRNTRRQLDASLRRLRDVQAEVASFGHGPPLHEDVVERLRALTDRPYDRPTWLIVLKNWRTLRRFYESTRRRGHWEGG